MKKFRIKSLPKAQYGIENYTVDYLGFDPNSPSWQQAPKYVQKGKSFHYKPNINLGKVSGEKFESPYKRTIGDFFYDVFKRGKKDPRIQQSFQTGGDLNPTMCPEGYTFNSQSNMCEPNIREFSPSLPHQSQSHGGEHHPHLGQSLIEDRYALGGHPS